MAEEFARGAGTVAFGTLGDPNLYSTFSYLAQTVRGHRAGRLDGAVIGARLRLAGELIAPAAEFLPGAQLGPGSQPGPDSQPGPGSRPGPGSQPGPDIPYLSTLIVPVRRGGRVMSLRPEPSAAGSYVDDVTLSRSHAAQCHTVHNSATCEPLKAAPLWQRAGPGRPVVT